jgi:hypothetical protein
LGYFYCDFRHPESQKASNVVGSLIAQLCQQDPPFPAWLHEIFTLSHSFSGVPSEAEPEFLETALKRVINEANGKVFIVIDALDECDDRERLVAFLRDLYQELERVCIMLTSRDEKNIREAFRGLSVTQVDNSSNEMMRDMALYIHSRLNNDPDFSWMKPQMKDYITEKLTADGGCPRM